MRFLIALFALAAPLAIAAACDDVTFYDVPIVDEAGIEGGLGVIDDGSGRAVTERFCARTDAGLCADFDGPNTGEWANATNQTAPEAVPAGADLEIGDGPTAKDLVATLPGGGDAASIAKGFIHAGTEPFRAEADLSIKPPGASWIAEPVGVFGIAYGTNGFTARVTLAGSDATNGKLGLELGSGTTLLKGSPIVPYDTWFHVTLTVDPTAESATLETSTGLTVSCRATMAIPAPAPAQLTLLVGLTRTAPTSTPTALILQSDNVLGFVQ